MSMADKDMMKIGLLVGMEWSMPPALITEINARSETTGVIADFVKLGGTEMNSPCEYRVIIDRISHEVPFYRTYLKNAALQGVKVVNDPFMWSSDDKYFGASVITRLGIASPRTVALPNKGYVPGIDHNKSLRNLIFPLDWNALVEAVGGFPCILKDAHGGGWKGVYVVHNMQELWNAYDESGLLTMVLQEFIAWDEYARNMCIAQKEVRVMRYDPNKRYYHPEHGFSPAMEQRLTEDTLAICQAFGYDMNTCEFAIKDGVPYAIDFMNPAPDMDVNSLGRGHFDWIIQTMANEMIALAQSKAATRDRYDWGKTSKKTAKPKGRVTS
jgi:glutathione synthase/RimK-type ligase-like ATP-grasp enzyme